MSHQEPSSGSALSPRQIEIAALVAEGLSNKEIAERLALMPRTVARHIATLTKRLTLRNRVQVAVWAVKNGLR